MVDYKTGQLYLIRNTQTQAGAYFEPFEVLPYRGHTIVYGVIGGYGLHLWRGVGEYGGKPVAHGQPNLERYGQKGVETFKLLLATVCGDDALTAKVSGIN